MVRGETTLHAAGPGSFVYCPLCGPKGVTEKKTKQMLPLLTQKFWVQAIYTELLRASSRSSSRKGTAETGVFIQKASVAWRTMPPIDNYGESPSSRHYGSGRMALQSKGLQTHVATTNGISSRCSSDLYSTIYAQRTQKAPSPPHLDGDQA